VALGRAQGGRIIGYHFASNVRDCLERNATRAGWQRVPDVAIYVAAKRLEVPTYAEGFDYLYRVRLVGQSDYEITALPRDGGRETLVFPERLAALRRLCGEPNRPLSIVRRAWRRKPFGANRTRAVTAHREV